MEVGKKKKPESSRVTSTDTHMGPCDVFTYVWIDDAEGSIDSIIGPPSDSIRSILQVYMSTGLLGCCRAVVVTCCCARL